MGLQASSTAAWSGRTLVARAASSIDPLMESIVTRSPEAIRMTGGKAAEKWPQWMVCGVGDSLWCALM